VVVEPLVTETVSVSVAPRRTDSGDDVADVDQLPAGGGTGVAGRGVAVGPVVGVEGAVLVGVAVTGGEPPLSDIAPVE
jgi:hypothetical protein